MDRTDARSNHHSRPGPRTPKRGSGVLPPPALLLFPALLLAACEGPPPADGERMDGVEIRQGPAISLGEGTARTYVILEGGTPLEVGVALSEDVLDGLPPDGAPGGMTMPDGHSTFEFVLEMPEDNPTPFLHATLDWNPAGHEPPGIYDHPHFDVHFYTISNSERMAIHPENPDFMEKALRAPPADQVPVGYVDPGLGAVPFMGVHWVDPTSPELHPEDPAPFTRTFLYGTWDGRMIFAEPMVTTEYLATRPNDRVSIPVAARYEPAGYYPESYVVRWEEEAREYRIGLADLAMRR
jgi:hypothetical protein